MANIKANGLLIEYGTFGEKSNPPMLLVMGLGAQMILWDEGFCEQLAGKGFYVVRFDNRDVGLTEKLDDLGVPKVLEIMAKSMKGEKVESPYSLDDMADDAAGLLDALEIDKAHICGASMGGMIVQTMAYNHPDRVLSMTSIMSSTGNPKLPPPQPDAMKVLMAPPPGDREGIIEHGINTWKVISGPGFEFDEDYIRDMLERTYDRSHYPPGFIRQLTAIVAHGSRVEKLAGVKAPTLVIHGSADPLVPVEAGKDTAESIPGAQLMLIEGMGHNLPKEAWPQIVGAISENAAKA